MKENDKHMLNDNSLDSKENILKEEYPKNLLLTMGTMWSVERAEYITDDVMQGLNYAISLLREREQECLRLRFQERLTREEIGKRFGVTRERSRIIELTALIKLKSDMCNLYISNGITGAVSIIKKENFDKGYKQGYENGFKDGINNAPSSLDGKDSRINVLLLPIEALCLTSGTRKYIKEARYFTIGEIVDLTEDEIRKIKKLTPERRAEVRDGLGMYGIKKTNWETLYYAIRSKSKNNK